MKYSRYMTKMLFMLFIFSSLFFVFAEDNFRTKLFESAIWAEKAETLQVEDRSFSMDCSGLIYAVSYKSGLDIQKLIQNYPGNGVKRIFLLLEENQAIVLDSPQVGDLIFWDNSYDKNGNGKRDDPLTHIGMVTDVNEDGLIHFIHYHYRLGVVSAVMDLSDPGNVERNSPMRARGASSPQEDGWTSGHLFRAFGRLEALYESPDQP